MLPKYREYQTQDLVFRVETCHWNYSALFLIHSMSLSITLHNIALKHKFEIILIYKNGIGKELFGIKWTI